MNLEVLIDDCIMHGIKLSVRDNKLAITAPEGKLKPAMVARLKENKSELIAWLSLQSHKLALEPSRIEQVDNDGFDVPASFEQKRLWFIDQLNGGTPDYNITYAVEFHFSLDSDVVSQVFGLLVDRHEALRTVYLDIDGIVYQKIKNPNSFKIEIFDLLSLPEREQHDFCESILNRESGHVYDLKSDYMLRVSLIQLGDSRSVLVFNVHHIAADGWALDLLANEFRLLYEQITSSSKITLPRLNLRYRDYAHWQKNWLQGSVLEAHLDYWCTQLKDCPVLHGLPTYPRPPIQTSRGAVLTGQLDKSELNLLNDFAIQHHCTLFQVLHAAFALLVAKLSGVHDVVIGTPVANRTQIELENIVGLFANTLALRTKIELDKNFSEFLSDVKELNLKALRYQSLPFDMVVESLNPIRSVSYSPVVQLMFSLDKSSENVSQQRIMRGRQLERENKFSKFDLTLSCSENYSGLCLTVEYNVDLFNSCQIEDIITGYKHLLLEICKNAGCSMSRLNYLPEPTIANLMQFSQSGKNLSTGLPVHKQFEIQANLNPNSIAVIDDQQSLTYAELNARANKLARYLDQTHQLKNQVAAISMARSANSLIAIMAVLKAGGCYLPLEQSYPIERQAYMLLNANACILLCDEIGEKIFSSTTTPEIIRFDDIDSIVSTYSESNPDTSSMCSEALAYMIYTSGSTGNPKGVVLRHEGLSNVIAESIDEFGLRSNFNMMQSSSFSFDASVLEWASCLASGATLHIVLKEVSTDIVRLKDWMAQHKIHWAFFTPALLNLMPTDLCDSLETIVVGGEVLELSLARKWSSHCRLYNIYGPTETTIFSTCKLIESQPNKITLGKPINRTSCFILDEHQQLVPVGTEGELYISGAGLAVGYHDNVALTESRFIRVDLPSGANVIAYKTGDRVKWNNDGEIEYIARIDNQVKIRGFRLEIGEIEAVLSEFQGVTQAVVSVEGLYSDKKLIAYLVAKFEHNTLNALKQHLRAKLPDFMVPSDFVILDEFPLSPSGKVDRRALEAMEKTLSQGEHYLPPQSYLELALHDIWIKVLGLGSFGVKDNFFSIGGHSLLVTRLVSLVEQTLSLKLSVRDVFEYPTIEALALLLQSQSQSEATNPINVVSKESPLPLSFSQRRLWFIDRLEGQSTQYHMPIVFRLQGAVDTDKLIQSLTLVIRRHEALRTVFKEVDGVPYQIVQATFTTPVSTLDLSLLSPEKQADELQRALAAFIAQPFDLRSDVMVRMQLCYLNSNEVVVALNMHHIASDGWSLGVFTKELSDNFNALSRGDVVHLAELPVQYGDFAVWQHERADDILASSMRYWQAQLEGAPPKHSLPLDKPRAQMSHIEGRVIKRCLNRNVSAELVRLAEQQDVTLFMLMQSAYALLIARLTQENDVVMGTPVSGRHHASVEPLIGFFVNMLALRCRVDVQQGFTDFLQASKKHLLDAMQHDQLPFEVLVETLKPEREANLTPIFQLLFSFHNNVTDTPIKLDGIDIELLDDEGTQCKFDIELTVVQGANDVFITWCFNKSLFDVASIEVIADSFEVLLAAIATRPEQSMALMPLLSEREKTQVLAYGEGSKGENSTPNIVALVEAFAAGQGDRLAVCDHTSSLTYAELNSQANRLAHYLRARYDIRNTVVAVCIPRSIELMVAVMAILKAGGAYLPLESSYPTDRLNYMLQDSQAKLLLCTDAELERFEEADLTRISINHPEMDAVLSVYPIDNTATGEIAGHDLAYMIYTSGSTGAPKGVQLEHQGLSNMISVCRSRFNLDSTSRILQFASFGFDAAVLEWTCALGTGGSLHITPEQCKSDIDLLANWLQSQTISWAIFTPAFLNLLPQDICPSLKTLLVGGEALELSLARKWASRCDLFNAYGPTEATVFATLDKIDASVDRVSIGKVISHFNGYILDKNQQLLPSGFPGELCLSGVGLARGYYNLPKQNEERFITRNLEGEMVRLYRTGDTVRWTDAGKLEFIGRQDNQIKLRGFRLELGEIEGALLACPGVASAIVLAEGEYSDKELIGYVAGDVARLSVREMKSQLRQRLPEFMVPGHIHLMSHFPMTANGKIDKHQLSLQEKHLGQDDYIVAPQTALQHALCGLWSELLGLPTVSIDDNFFSIGGHSLLVIKLIDMVYKQCGIKAEVSDIFAYPTIEAFAAFVEKSKDKATEQQTDEALLSNELANLFCLPGAGALSSSFAHLSNGLKGKFNIVAFDYHGALDNKEHHESLNEMAAFYTSCIVNTQPHGVVNLLGHSFGGVVALKTAQDLQDKGRNVNLIIIDSYLAPKYLPVELFSTRDPSSLADDPEVEYLNDFVTRTHTIEALGRLESLLSHQIKIMQNFDIRPVMETVKVLFIYASESFDFMSRYNQLDWVKREMGRYVTIKPVEGDHFSILSSKKVGVICSEISKWLEDEVLN